MMLEIRDVKKSFDKLTVLDGISLDVEKATWWLFSDRAGRAKPPSCGA